MRGKTFLVTGANGRLGSVIAQHLQQQGLQIAAGVRTSNVQAAVPSGCHPVVGDLSSSAGARQVVESTIARFGAIDGAVHTVGGFAFGGLHEMPEQDWRRLVDENLNAAYYLLRELLPRMRERRFGRIVMIGSLAVTPQAGTAAYASTKTALHVLVQAAAMENREFGITINAILPGTIETTAAVGRWLSPQKIAHLSLALLRDESGLLTGALLPLER